MRSAGEGGDSIAGEGKMKVEVRERNGSAVERTRLKVTAKVCLRENEGMAQNAPELSHSGL